MCKVIFVSTI